MYLSLMEQARQAEELRDWKTAAQLYTQAMAVSPKGGLRANGTKTYAKKLIHCLN